MSRTQRRLIAALLVATIPSGCYKWGTVTGPLASVIDRESTKKVKLTHRGDSTLVLERSRVRKDTLRGNVPSKTGVGSRLHVIPVAEIEKVQVRKLDRLATGGTILGATVAALGVAAIVALATWEGPFAGCCR